MIALLCSGPSLAHYWKINNRNYREVIAINGACERVPYATCYAFMDSIVVNWIRNVKKPYSVLVHESLKNIVKSNDIRILDKAETLDLEYSPENFCNLTTPNVIRYISDHILQDGERLEIYGMDYIAQTKEEASRFEWEAVWTKHYLENIEEWTIFSWLDSTMLKYLMGLVEERPSCQVRT